MSDSIPPSAAGSSDSPTTSALTGAPTPSDLPSDSGASALSVRSGSRRAVVTGASSGIGAATVRRLRSEGWDVVAVARRADKLQALASETGAEPFPADVSDDGDVERLRVFVSERGGLDTLINIAGGARGVDKVGGAQEQDWEWMYRVNVLGTMKMIRAFLPALREHGEGTVVNLTSTAGLAAYEGGAGYNAAKFAQHALNNALRLEEAEHNLRVVEVAPGLVRTEEFALNRMDGDREAAQKVYAGVEKPLTADDVARVVAYAVGLPHHINLDQIVIRPVAQASNYKMIRRSAE